MKKNLKKMIKEIAGRYDEDRHRLMDIVREVQAELGGVSSEAIDLIAHELKIPRVEVEGVVTFYAFLSKEQHGPHTIRVTDCVAAKTRGADQITRAFERLLRIECGETTRDGRFTLERTSCIGMCDQGPAALIGTTPVTNLSSCKARDVVQILKKTDDHKKLVETVGEGNNASELIRSMVHNNIRKAGEVIFAPMDKGEAIKHALAMSPTEVIRELKTARLRGRGGAGFPTGMKWEFARNSNGKRKFMVCNADEGEPGTFKDRVILTECPDLVFEGMTIGGYAVGAQEGILYLRGEYEYLKAHLEHVLEQRRKAGLLGKKVCGHKGFGFDIRIQLGAGAYICGEESALINSCEGLRGSPRDRPPFPVEKGYLDLPTSVNNVETFCCAARVLEKGAVWFTNIGSEQSTGTKLLSVSGDCVCPGIYELPFGVTLKELLAMVGGEEAQAVQVGGPSGACVDSSKFDRGIGFEDLATGGSIMVFGPGRDVLEVASSFMDFFIEESCGYCTPCRVGNVLIKERLDRIRHGRGLPEDLSYLEELCETVKKTSRCGLGQTSPNPVQSTLANFRHLYESRLLKEREDGKQPTFDFRAAMRDAVAVQGREPVVFEH